MTTAPSTVISAWNDFYASAPLKAPVTEADYLDLKALADYLIDHHNIEAEPYAALFNLVTGHMDAWERANEPELKDVDVPPHVMLAHYLEERGITAYRLAKDLGVDQGNLSGILSGTRGISKGLAKKLGAYFHTSAEVFL